MNKRFPLYALLCLVMMAAVASCSNNDDSSSSYSSTSYASTRISAFSLGNNDDVLYNLDSVFFTIDQDQCLIYNADSLPKGTNVTALTVSITFPVTVGEAKFIVKDGTKMKDTTFNYSSETSDSIDFTGNVKLDVKSYDGTKERVYTIKVNVHQLEPDSLSWNQSARRDLPSISGNVKEEKTVEMDGDYYCLINEGNNKYTLSYAENPGQGTWDKEDMELPFTPQVHTFTASNSALYVLDTEGKLYKSSDEGLSWTNCGVTWSNILGGYEEKVLGVFYEGGVFKHDEYPRGSYVPVAVEDSFPVNQSSTFTMSANTWTIKQQGMMVGGVASKGERVSGVWGYDGTTWGLISDPAKGKLPALREPSIVSYYTFNRDSTTHDITKNVTWLLFGGMKANGALNTTTYISYDQGISWSTGGKKLQLPSYIPNFYGSQAFVVEETLKKARRRSQVTPITEWDCPYIYLVGGMDANGNVLNNIWKGVINRLTGKPIY